MQILSLSLILQTDNIGIHNTVVNVSATLPLHQHVDVVYEMAPGVTGVSCLSSVTAFYMTTKHNFQCLTSLLQKHFCHCMVTLRFILDITYCVV